jgi:N utilization substance protein A
MPAIVKSDFALAVNQVCSERGLDPEVVLETIRQAILMAYKKDRFLSANETVEIANFLAELDGVSGEARIFTKKDDGTKGEDVTPPGFGRIAAQTAKQVIIQRIREAEKKAVIDDFSQKIGTIVQGLILRSDGPNFVVDIGKAEAIMPPQEQTPTERYFPNQRMVFYVAAIRESARGSEIIVSRAHEGLVLGLFKREVPEIANGSVTISAIAREAGGRTKVAVSSNQTGVDPVGACVGQKGVRVQAVIAELGGSEKVDIIQFSEDAAEFIARALAPAKEIEVVLDEVNQQATAIIPAGYLSLAIGLGGQNVRVAAKLTKWRIDIKSKDGTVTENQNDQNEAE